MLTRSFDVDLPTVRLLQDGKQIQNQVLWVNSASGRYRHPVVSTCEWQRVGQVHNIWL